MQSALGFPEYKDHVNFLQSLQTPVGTYLKINHHNKNNFKMLLLVGIYCEKSVGYKKKKKRNMVILNHVHKLFEVGFVVLLPELGHTYNLLLIIRMWQK